MSSSVAFRLGGTTRELWVSYLLLRPSTLRGLRTIRESQRSIQGIFSRGKVQRLPNRIYSIHLRVVEPEQWVAWRGEEIVVDT
jgi:hypothetical protein